MTGQLHQITNNSRPSNAFSDDDEPDLQQILVEEAFQCWSNPKKASKIEGSQIEKQTQIYENFSLWFIKGIQSRAQRQYWVSQFSQLDINEMFGMYILFFYFCSKRSCQ